MRTLELRATKDEMAVGPYHRMVVEAISGGALYGFLLGAAENGREVRMLDSYYLVHNMVLGPKGSVVFTLVRR